MSEKRDGKRYRKRKNNTKGIMLSISIICLVIAGILYFTEIKKNTLELEEPQVTATPTQKPLAIMPPTITIPPNSTVSILTAGDNLIHSSLYEQANKRAGGGKGEYDFTFAYENIVDMIDGYDITMINQETLVNDVFSPASYPMFNSPTEVGDEILEIGFDTICHANNHVLDKKEGGIVATLDYWDRKDAFVYGAYKDEADLQDIKLKEINGITFSFLGVTEHTNGMPLYDSYKVEVVFANESQRIKDWIEKAELVSDVVVISAHWGDENINTPNANQKNFAKEWVGYGADLIVGTHPHVVQDMEFIEKPDGGDAFVIYSLGNFISAQNRSNNLLGQLVALNVVKNGLTGEISFENIKAMPVVTHYTGSYKNITMYPFAEYTAEMANSHGLKTMGKEFSLEYLNGILDEYINPEFLEKEKVW